VAMVVSCWYSISKSIWSVKNNKKLSDEMLVWLSV